MEQQQTLFKVRDLREKTQFKIDDVYLNGYARVCGKDATLVYTSLCRHAEFNTQKAFPSQNKIAYEHKISVRTVKRGLKKLIEYRIVIVNQERQKGRFMNYLYTLLDKSEWKKITGCQNIPMVNGVPKTVGRLTANGAEPTKDNKELRITNNKDNKDIIKQSFIGKDINDLIELFKPINPSYERLFANKTQRASLERLVKKYGNEKVEKMITGLKGIFGQPYAPTITTPFLLEQKLADYIGYIKKRSNEKINFIDFTKL